MRRFIKIFLICMACLLGVVGIGFFSVVRTLMNSQEESANEIVITPEYLQGMRSAGLPIFISRAFTASSYGGLHDDGTSLTVYKYPPSESKALLAALLVKNPDLTWSDTIWPSATMGRMTDLLPKDLLPLTRTEAIQGRASQGFPANEMVICPSSGLFYFISHRL